MKKLQILLLVAWLRKKQLKLEKELEDKYMQNDDRNLIEYINKNLGFSADNMSMIKGFGDVGGSSTASLEIYILDSEETTMLP